MLLKAASCGEDHFKLPFQSLAGVLALQIGDQTTGKSTLVEALGYGIRLPRKEGICTKAPLELRLRTDSAEGISCRVSYRPYHASGRQLEREVLSLSESQMKDPDVLSEIVTDLSNFLIGKGDHSKHPDWKVEGGKSVSPLKTYTKDVIILDLYGADVPLTIVDLPGIIHSNAVKGASREAQAGDVAFPREIAEGYLLQEDAIIVCVMAGNRDPQTQVCASVPA
jgi:hypothetical protein